jgi:HAMP domain-containing protein
MTLKTLFAIPITIILLVTLVLAGTIAGQGWTGQARGKAAAVAVESMRLLLLLQSDLRMERVATNLALAKDLPISKAVVARLEEARQETDGRAAQIVRGLRIGRMVDAVLPEPYMATLLVRLGMSRAAIDHFLAIPRKERTFTALSAIQPRMVSVSQALEQPIERAGQAVTLADATLSGLLTEERLSASLRDQAALITGVMMPRINGGEQLTSVDEERIGLLVAQSSTLVRLLRQTIEVAGTTDAMRAALADLERADRERVLDQLKMPLSLEQRSTPDDAGYLPFQRFLVPWGEQVNVLRMAIVDAVVSRVTDRRVSRDTDFNLVLTGFGLVMIAILESIFLLSRRVVGPLAQLGIAIRRIAAGDRSVPVTMRSSTREIAEMVMAVETLREAALVADAASMRQRMAARQRLSMLREALGIAQTVQEPARALERDVEQLSKGIDATIALVTLNNLAPATLGAAAAAVRAGLDEIRQSAAGLSATFAAASGAQTEDRPPAEFVAHIRAVAAEVDRRDVAVRTFVQPSLAALRDASASGAMPEQVLRDLVSDQFERIETTVAVIASMRSAMTRAASIVRDLPLDETPLAA